MNGIQNPELGYYQVGDVCHYGKVSALIDGSVRNIHPVWRFNDEVFDKYDWSVEPVESLLELYQQRAAEIREKYDYVILMYSAGSDSQTMLEAFLTKNLKVDEIVVMHPHGLEKTYTPDDTNFDPMNMLSEWHFTIKPKLQWLAQHHPNIKITMFDWSEGICDYNVEDGFIMDRSHNISPYAQYRNDFYRINSVKDAVDKYSKVGIILGVDKPRICFHENAYKLYFLDIVTCGIGPQGHVSMRKNNLSMEFFYWSPKSCKLLAKQAHELIKFFELFPAFKIYITWPIQNISNRTWYERSVKPIIYPNFDFGCFQANKANNLTIGSDELLFRIGLRDRVLHLLEENIKHLKSIIDPKYFNNIDGIPVLTGFVSKMWPVKYAKFNG